ATASRAVPQMRLRAMGPRTPKRYRRDRVPAAGLVTQTSPRSEAQASGPRPTGLVSSTVPSIARSLVTESARLLTTQIAGPDAVSPAGAVGTGKVPAMEKAFGRTLSTTDVP